MNITIHPPNPDCNSFGQDDSFVLFHPNGLQPVAGACKVIYMDDIDIYTDADIEMREMEEIGNLVAAGLCVRCTDRLDNPDCGPVSDLGDRHKWCEEEIWD